MFCLSYLSCKAYSPPLTIVPVKRLKPTVYSSHSLMLEEDTFDLRHTVHNHSFTLACFLFDFLCVSPVSFILHFSRLFLYRLTCPPSFSFWWPRRCCPYRQPWWLPASSWAQLLFMIKKKFYEYYLTTKFVLKHHKKEKKSYMDLDWWIHKMLWIRIHITEKTGTK